jgi:hypothetical protein
MTFVIRLLECGASWRRQLAQKINLNVRPQTLASPSISSVTLSMTVETILMKTELVALYVKLPLTWIYYLKQLLIITV